MNPQAHRPDPVAARTPAAGRRRFLTGLGAMSLLAAAGPWGLAGCRRQAPLVRVAGTLWIGYETLFLARELGYYRETELRLVEYPSNTASLMALATGDVEAATLTLDELLLAREGGLDVRVILVFDRSNGADVIMARPAIPNLGQLKGKRIAVEETASGALMLAKLLEAAGLSPADLIKVPLTADRHLAAYRTGEVDALVSFEPYATLLEAAGARRLLDSSRFPGLIADVLVATNTALAAAPEPFRHLVDGHFRAVDYLRQHTEDAARRMAPRLGITPEAVLKTLQGIDIPTAAENRAWLSGPSPRLASSAEAAANIMQAAKMLRHAPDLSQLTDSRFLPERP